MLDFGFYNMDCMEGMAQFPDKFFDLAIVDPPYGLGEANMKKNKSRGKLANAKAYKSFAGLDIKPPDKAYFDELFRVSKNQIIWGANHFIAEMPYSSPCWIVWNKENGDTDFADCELAWASFKSAVRMLTFRWAGMLQGNMKNKELRIHPTQKPVALYEWLLARYAKPGDKILDTHTGSASSLVACHRGGYQYVGFELDPDYYKAASQRLEAEKAQMTIFDFGIQRL